MRGHRRPANRRSDKKQFTRTAARTHGKNLPHTVMRGGYRL